MFRPLSGIGRVVLATVLALAAAPAEAQVVSKALAGVTALKCAFTVLTTGTWEKTGDATSSTTPSTLTLEYEAIDTVDGSAEVKGLSGNLFITVRLVASNMHLLAIDNSGPVYLTTVFDSPGRPGRYKAAHSRHEFTPVSLPGFTSRPEQYVGDCELVK